MTDPNHIAEARKKVSRPQIREVFLRNGARIEPDRDDLPDWVYESVFELLDSVIQQAGPAIQYVGPAIQYAGPAVQGEPVEYQCHSCRKTTPPPAPFKAYVECGECGALTAAPIAVRLAAPQPAEQQPQPESATHYRPSTGVYYQVIDGKTYAWRDAKVGWMPSPRKGIPDDCVCLMPSEQQPAQDVAGLVEALEGALNGRPLDTEFWDRCEQFIAAHRKQGDRP